MIQPVRSRNLAMEGSPPIEAPINQFYEWNEAGDAGLEWEQ
jgi:hypothetical protein